MAKTDRHFCRPFFRGTLLVLVMSGLLYAVQLFVFCAIKLSLKGTLRNILGHTYYAFFVLLPVTGWVAESWLGRYRAILVGLIMSAVTVALSQTIIVMLQLNLSPVLGLIMSIVALALGMLGAGSLYTNMLPFTLDRASAEELSAVVQWYYWGFTIAKLIKDLHHCVLVPKQLQFLDIVPVVLLVLGSLCLSAVLIMDCLYHKWLNINDEIGHPIKLIFGVLNSARKNKYP